MDTSGRTHDDEQQASRKFSWRALGRRQSKLRSNEKCAHLFEAVPEDWHVAAIKGDFSKLAEVKALNPKMVSTPNGYAANLKALLTMEQAYESIGTRRFDMFKKRLVKTAYYRYAVSVNGLSDGRPDLRPGDYVILRDHKHDYKKILREHKHDYKIMSINWIEGDSVIFQKDRYEREDFFEGELDIFFWWNRYSSYQGGVERFNCDPSLKARLFHGSSIFSGMRERYHTPVDRVLSEDDERLGQFNGPQRRAILNILEARFFPRPYILFGPPGTGKTDTLAEAMVQIYIRKHDCKILYSANSKTCVDQMADRLEKVPIISQDDTCSLFAVERDSVKEKRIVLTTNKKSSSLIDSIKFDYVFIDEAGHANGIESLSPICCLKRSGSLVLAGDPKQLGPVVKCEQASKYGLGVTLLDRLLESKIYQRDRTTGQYDSRYITKLLVSYRCDPRILSISNKLFYDNELQCVNETPRSLLRMMRITNPLQFCHVEGQEEQPMDSSSWRNLGEVDECVDLIIRLYKMGLTPDQIGVISPYKLQTDEIRENLDERINGTGRLRGFLEDRFIELVNDQADDAEKSASNCTESKIGEVQEARWFCKIDPVDEFQGNEREVIIISTVRTNSKGEHAFVNDPRRFNVAISRAKWLVFVIGHEGFIQNQSNWNQFIGHAGRDLSKWPSQSKSDPKPPSKRSRPLLRLNIRESNASRLLRTFLRQK